MRPGNGIEHILISKINDMKLIDLSSIVWTSEKRDWCVRDMHTDHICRALAWIVARQQMAEKILEKVPTVFREKLTHHNGRNLSEWVDIFSAVLHDRSLKEKEEKLKALKARLQEILPPDEKIRELEEQIKRIEED